MKTLSKDKSLSTNEEKLMNLSVADDFTLPDAREIVYI
jgi:hypothetical protein